MSKIASPEASKKYQKVDLRERYPDNDNEAMNSATERRQVRRVTERQKYTTIAEEIAKSTFYYLNHKWDIGNKVYPNDNDMEQRFVSRAFPLAEKGMLLVSEPRTPWETKQAWDKHKVLIKAGYRHFVMEENTALFDAIEQLGEI